MTFGLKVKDLSMSLAEQGKDPNQIAGILCGRDEEGHNYGIGVLLGGDGRPLQTPSVFFNSIEEELKGSRTGTYLNSNKLIEQLKESVLTWQRIPKTEWDKFILALPSDAGTGAVQTAIQVALAFKRFDSIEFEELGWPAYKAIAEIERIPFKEIPIGSVANEKSLPLYQSGPLNTTGLVHDKDLVEMRAAQAAQSNQMIVLDRAYSGFEFARDLESAGYDELMKESFHSQVAPFIEKGVPFLLAVSPTKAFVTFSLRPCGFLLAYCPSTKEKLAMETLLGIALRARGASFEHVVTRAFVKAFIHHRSQLEAEHVKALTRLTRAESAWREGVHGTAMARLFADHYAGLFRNAVIREGAEEEFYSRHLYPVLSQGRCRINITGIPDQPETAKQHLSVFSKYCS